MRLEKGLIHVITGDGPGKTTSALGKGMRAAGHGFKVCMIQFMKHGARNGEEYGEIIFLKNVSNFVIQPFGLKGWIDPKKPEEFAKHKEKAQEGFEQTRKILQENRYDLVILEEINLALQMGLIETQEVVDLIKNKPPNVELMLTGRDAPPEIINLADYVIVISEAKHPYRSWKQLARKGIEY